MLQLLLRMQAIAAWLLTGNCKYYLLYRPIAVMMMSFLLLTVSCYRAQAQIDSTYITTCSTFLAPEPYHDFIRTYAPATADSKMYIAFTTYYQLGEGDVLYAYDGSSTQAPLIGTYVSSQDLANLVIRATNPAGHLTIRFSTANGDGQSDFLAHVVCAKPPQATDVIMSSTPVTTSGGKFYHPHYPATMRFSDNFIQTLTPATPGAKLKVKFDSFAMGSKRGSRMNTLYVYDGANVNAPLIGVYDSFRPIYAVRATNPAGQLTFKLVGGDWDYIQDHVLGWDATISYVTNECSANLALPETIPSLVPGQPYTISLQASPAGNYRYTTTAGWYDYYFPAEASLNFTTGEFKIFNTNDAAGAEIVVRVTDENGCFDEKEYHILKAVAPADSTYSTTCGASFGPSNRDYIRTYAPATAGNFMFISFPQYHYLSTDVLYIYDGTSTKAPLMVSYIGDVEGQTITATNPSGALTIRYAGTNDNQSDFEGEVRCVKPIQSTDVIMSSTPVTTAGGKYYHPNYPDDMMDSDNVTQTLTPDTPGAKLKVKFDSFDTGGRYMGTLYVYDGPSTSSPLIGAYRTVTPIFAVRATNPTGELTFKFVGANTQDGRNNRGMGWDATISYVNEACPSNLSLPATIPPLIYENYYRTTFQASPAGNYRYTILYGVELTDRNDYDFNSVTGELKLSYPYDGNVILIRATNENGCFVDKSYTLTKNCPTITLPTTLAQPTKGIPYSASVAASPVGTYVYASTTVSGVEIDRNGLPPGLSLHAQTGEITGTFTGARPTKEFIFSIQAVNERGCGLAKTYQWNIECGTVQLGDLQLSTATIGQPYSIDRTLVANENGIPSLVNHLSVQGLPPGLTLVGDSTSSSLKITGVPTVPGTYSITITAIVDNHCPASKTYSLLVASPYLPGTSKVRLNCGGPSFKVDNGLTFQADAYFSGVTKTSLTGGDIANTVNDALYHTDRVADVDKGTFRYQLPVTNGKYQVNLFLAETYFTAPGKRVMSVKAEGNPILTNYDIFAAQGKRSAKKLSYLVMVTDGNLTLDFSATVNRPKINAIEVVPAPASAAREEEESPWSSKLSTSPALVAYPNPFAEQTTVRFTAPASGKASVAVYDLSGSLVKVLFEGQLEEGVAKELTLDGASFPSGVYLVKALTSSGVSHLKLVLTK